MPPSPITHPDSLLPNTRTAHWTVHGHSLTVTVDPHAIRTPCAEPSSSSAELSALRCPSLPFLACAADCHPLLALPSRRTRASTKTCGGIPCRALSPVSKPDLQATGHRRDEKDETIRDRDQEESWPELTLPIADTSKKPPTGSQWPAQTPLQTLFAATARKTRQTAPRAPSHLFPNYGSPVGATENSTKETSQIQASPSQLFQTPMFAVGVRGSLNKPTAPAGSIWLRYPTPFTVAPAASSTRHRRKGGCVSSRPSRLNHLSAHQNSAAEIQSLAHKTNPSKLSSSHDFGQPSCQSPAHSLLASGPFNISIRAVPWPIPPPAKSKGPGGGGCPGGAADLSLPGPTSEQRNLARGTAEACPFPPYTPFLLSLARLNRCSWSGPEPPSLSLRQRQRPNRAFRVIGCDSETPPVGSSEALSNRGSARRVSLDNDVDDDTAIIMLNDVTRPPLSHERARWQKPGKW
ncbi:hypothetical protein K456DRAFT_38545 [Colletotrichum gloeosporioides 23]|nr:hypothetical protein K456DRAFT_38545 [Colletotrichum gloeosporioides 23]